VEEEKVVGDDEEEGRRTRVRSRTRSWRWSMQGRSGMIGYKLAGRELGWAT
jgi:hypothetical protein